MRKETWRWFGVVIGLGLGACQGDVAGSMDVGGADGGGLGDMAGGPVEGNPLLNGITDEHNKVRAGVKPAPTTPLPLLTWSPTVAATAQAWANKCMFSHNPSTAYGENIYASSGSATPAAVVTSWASESANYNYAANTCSGGCGHYTQVVWRDSLRLGCGVTNCTMNSPFGTSNGGKWQFWVCNYDPPGNVNGVRPY